MTRKKAIKTIMSVTCHGDKRAASYTFDMVKNVLSEIQATPMFVTAHWL